VSDWVPATLAGIGTFLTVMLLLDLLRRR
jgi:hypothetical protein